MAAQLDRGYRDQDEGIEWEDCSSELDAVEAEVRHEREVMP
jgi:hypothetical protein